MTGHRHDHAAQGRAPSGPSAPPADTDPRQFWEQRYGDGQVWSGRVNATTAALVDPLPPGRSLDLGCGEGGDVLHLARRGWHALGVDISTHAIARARQAAADRAHELTGTAAFHALDLSADDDAWDRLAGSGGLDLVTASFLQSPVALDRARILSRAAHALAPGGRLVVVSHGAPPAWAPPEFADDPARFPSPQDELDTIGARGCATGLRVLIAEQRDRPATGPDEQHDTLVDTVVVVERL